MKQLEITTNKRLLIVELPNNDCEFGGLLKNRNLYFFTEKMSSEEDYPVCYPLPYDCEFICKGSDLTEDIAKGLVPNDLGFLFDGDSKEYHAYPDYKNIDHPFEDKSFDTALESFISAIQSKNYHWGENPYEKELDSCKAYTDMFTIAKRAMKYEESESRTFNPEKCIICEIV